MKKFTISTLLIFLATLTFGQAKTLSVINFDVEKVPVAPQQLVSLTFSEIAKLDSFLLKDKYTVMEAANRKGIQVQDCLGEQCLLDLGEAMAVDYVVSGRAILINDKLILSMRLFDINSNKVARTTYSEFAYNSERLDKLVKISIADLFQIKIDKSLKNSYDYDKVKESEMDGPSVKRINLSGPRFGVSMLTDKNAMIFQRPKSQGGFGKSPVLTVIGYQNEYQYLNTGIMSAILQTNVSIAGLSQQMAIPSLSFVQGFRFSNGWEFGFGPVLRLTQTENIVGETTLASDFPENLDYRRQLDSRGPVALQSAWIYAIGRSFQLGQMNVPINLYGIPDKDGWLVGLSMGWAINAGSMN